MDYMLSLLTFFLGLGLGHWLALERDKRKEFNDASSELYSKLYDYINKDNACYLPSAKELDLFSAYIPKFRRWLYKIRVKQLNESVRNDKRSRTSDPVQGTVTTDPKYVSHTKLRVKKLLWHLERI